MTKREGYSKRMERNLAGWNKRFEARLQEANRDGSALVKETREELASWKASSDAVTGKLAELREAAARWISIRDDLEATWQQIAGVMGNAEPPVTPAAVAERKTAVSDM